MTEFLLMEATEAAMLAEATAGGAARLMPRAIVAGPHTGRHALPARVADDPDFAAHHAALAALERVALDIDAAWPVQGED